MKSKIFLLFFVTLFLFRLSAAPWTHDYSLYIAKKADERLELKGMPSLKYPNVDFDMIPFLFPAQKVLLFGYGSLIGDTALWTISKEAFETKFPCLAFGAIRLFNYESDRPQYWGPLPNEKGMLNLKLTENNLSFVNGIAFLIEKEDLGKLVEREKGYDLVPILVAPWQELIEQKKEPAFQIAYTFVASNEPRGDRVYTSSSVIPVRWYVKMVQKAAISYGQTYLDFWNETTYCSDGLTPIEEWMEQNPETP